MKLISARASRAPAPTSTENRAPAILVPRSKSMMPSAGPRSQCACGVKAERRAACRARRTSTLSAALFPTGTLACGTFGIVSRPRLRRCSIASSSTLQLLDLLRALRGSLPGSASMSQPLPLGARHLVARRVLLALQPFELRQQPAALALRAPRAPRARRVRSAPRFCSAGCERRRGCREEARDRACGFDPISALLRYDDAHGRHDPQGGLPRRRPRHALPARHQGAAQGDARARRQAGHPVRRRGGRRSPASTTSSSSPAAARTPSRITSTWRWSSRAFSSSAARRRSSKRSARSRALINVAYVRQGEPLGLGHAVLVTKNLVGDEPFAVILGDDVIDANPPALKQMIDVYRARAAGRCSRSSACPTKTSRATASSPSTRARTSGRGVHRIKDLVEKPRREDAPSNLAIIGRYILTPDIFPALEATASDRTGEIQLTNGLRRLLQKRPIYACEIDGVRHDTGNKLGFLKALVYFALQAAGPGRAVPALSRNARPEDRRRRPSPSRDRAGRRRAPDVGRRSWRPCRSWWRCRVLASLFGVAARGVVFAVGLARRVALASPLLAFADVRRPTCPFCA